MIATAIVVADVKAVVWANVTEETQLFSWHVHPVCSIHHHWP